MTPLHQATRIVPIVFTQTPDPVGAGFVASLARPGGNATGFTLFEFGISVKWLELLKEIAPHVARAAALRDPALSSGLGELGAIQGVAPTFRVELSVIDVREASEIERSVAAFARQSNGALIVLSSAVAIVHRDQIIRLAARHQLPTVYFARYFVAAGGLISYGPDTIDPHRRAAAYVDRILRAKSRPTFRCRRRPSTSWRSTSRPLRRSALQCLQRCSRAPTRWSSSLASASARLLQLLTAACGTQETVSPAAERSAY
jgi:putative ABC transport system substrate-binding protein